MADEPKKPTLEDILGKFFECRDQVHLWHFQTTSYAEHKALNKFYDALLDKADEITEVWQGHSGHRVAGLLPIRTAPYKNVATVTKYFMDFMTWLGGLRNQIEYKEIQNLIDDLTATTAQTIYLLSLS